MMEFFESLGVDMEVSDMSFSVSLDGGRGCEWGSRNGFSGLFAQKMNIVNPYFWTMIREIIKFKDDVLNYLEELDNNPDIDRTETLGHFVQSHGYSELFQKAYLIPICGSIWSCSSEGVMSFSAYSILSFCRNHYLLQVRDVLESRGCHIRTNSEVCSVSANDDGCTISCKDGSEDTYDGCIIAAHAPDALKMLGKQATFDELRILGAFQYAYSDIFLHRDKTLMPKNPAAWSAWNFLGSVDNKVCVTYWLNILQNISETGLPFLVTLNPPSTPEHTLLKWSTGHPIPSVAATKAASELNLIQGKRRIWFCGAYQAMAFHEDGLKAGVVAANGLLKRCTLQNNPKHMCRPGENGHVFLLLEFMFFNTRGWWTPLLFTSAIASAKYFYQHMSRQNTLTQARRNISRHYDLTQDEDLKIAQLRKVSLLIEKARINKDHHILEIGCGWGTLAIEAVRRTGCKYTGITLSEQQLQYAEAKVKEAGLQDRIKFLLCDYRQLPNTDKYDRIISCEMLEAVGHEYMEEFFRCCESVLEENGILVLQFISIPDERYDEYRQSSDFIKEYIFPGGCLPSLSRVTTAMAAASRLCVEHLEDIGIHYYQTLRRWRESFLKKQSKIQALGFNEKFIRTWEYYFDYCAAGFKTCTLGNYQIVFSRPGNVEAFGDPYKAIPSAY
ncbi:UNVERIFIED_CONTAM: Sphingolipid C9-methyltransferase 1 [Sesamum calycinum]|uniref:Sphingolipid C9-methyltransferase 1 n=1 Tax=Sesamum calycinum TaxID=2727403 RepID=A0AAW2QMD2_9LAMI